MLRSIGQNLQTKMKLNISQLALAKLAQSGRHQSRPRTQEVPGSIPTEGNFFGFFFALPYVSPYCQHCIIMENCNGSNGRTKGIPEINLSMWILRWYKV